MWRELDKNMLVSVGALVAIVTMVLVVIVRYQNLGREAHRECLENRERIAALQTDSNFVSIPGCAR